MATISTDSTYSAISGGYSNNELINIINGAKLTIDQSTVDLRYIRCTTFGECLIKNTSTTTPIVVALGSTGSNPQFRFEAAGVSTVEGEWITLGTGNGVAGQVFNVPLAQGVHGVGTQSLPDVGFLWINGTDTLRDGTSIPRLALSVDSGGYTNATDHELGGNVFEHDTLANTVTFKRAIPSGQEVYMPNIFFITGASFTSSQFTWDYANSGQANLNKCIWSGKFNYNALSAKQIQISNSGFVTSEDQIFNLANQIQPPFLSNVGIKSSETTSSCVNISNSASAGTHTNLWIDTNLVGNHNVINASATSSPRVEKLVATCYKTGTTTPNVSGSRGTFSTNSPNSILFDLFDFTYGISVLLNSGASSPIVDNVNFECGCRNDTAFALSNKKAVNALGSVSNGLITNIKQIKLTGNFSNTQFINLGAGTSNNIINGVVCRSGAAGSGVDRWDNIISDNGNGNRFNNIVVYGHVQDRAVLINANSIALEVTNLYFVELQNEHNLSQTVGARTRLEQIYLSDTNLSGFGSFASGAIASGVDSLSVVGIRNSANGGAVEKTDGVFYLRFSPVEEQTDYLTTVTQTGVIQFNNGNRLYIQNSGDVIELQSFVHNNVSAIATGAELQGNGISDFAVTVKMRRPGGTYTSYVATNQTDMQTAYASLAADTQNRVQFKFRIEKTATNLSAYLDRLRFNLTLTGDDYPFKNNLPVTAPNLLDGTRARLYNVTKSAEVDNSVVTGGSGYSAQVDVFAATADVGDTFRLTATYVNGVTAKKEFSALGILTSTGLSIIDTQVDDPVYNANAVDGSSITLFSADYANDEVDVVVGNNFTSKQFYAWWSYNLTTAQGITEFFGGVTAQDTANYLINNSVVNIFFDITTNDNVYQNDNARIYRADSAYPVKDPTTGGGAIDLVWREKVLIASSDDIQTTINAILVDTGTTLPAQITALNNLSATEAQNAVSGTTLDKIQKLAVLIPERA
jgi:hypothetical protein